MFLLDFTEDGKKLTSVSEFVDSAYLGDFFNKVTKMQSGEQAA
jgi:hypothetical protein